MGFSESERRRQKFFTMELERAGVRSLTLAGTNLLGSCPFHEAKSGTPFSMSWTKGGAFTCYSCGTSGKTLEAFWLALGDEGRAAAVRGAGDPEPPVTPLPPWRERSRGGSGGSAGGLDPDPNPRTLPGGVTLTEDLVTGWCGTLPQLFRDRGMSDAVLRRWGVGWDRFRQWVTFPVRDGAGNLRGVTVRNRPGWDPKYLHFVRKSVVLYGENVNSRAERVWVGEGPGDALGMAMMVHRSDGVRATLGAQVSDHQITLLKKARELILGFDDDEAGRAAVLKVGLATDAYLGGRVYVPTYSHGAKDPGEVWQKGGEAVATFTGQLIPFNEWLWKRQHGGLVRRFG